MEIVACDDNEESDVKLPKDDDEKQNIYQNNYLSDKEEECCFWINKIEFEVHIRVT